MLLDIKVSRDILMTFGTPRLERRFDNPALNDALARIVLGREARHPAVPPRKEIDHSNIGGWWSEPDLLGWPEPEIATLKGMIHEGVGQVMQLAGGGRPVQIRADFNLVAWANVSRRGSYNPSQSYPGSHWSGIYFVSCGRPDPGWAINGAVELVDPRPAAAAALIPGFEFGYRERIEPVPGLMLVFPSWQVHLVYPFYGEGEMVSIGFNLVLHDFALMPGGPSGPTPA